MLTTLAEDPKHFGGIPQFLLALHTWNGRLDYHLHVHALMAAGAFDPTTGTWIPAKNEKFLFPIDALSKLFRGKFLAGLKRLANSGRLSLDWPDNQPLRDPSAWQDFLDAAYGTRFLTFVDKPAAGPENVLEYLGHYLHRTGISNSRLLALEDGQVTFACKDRKKKRSTTGTYPRTLSVHAFVDLFAPHILPKAFASAGSGPKATRSATCPPRRRPWPGGRPRGRRVSHGHPARGDRSPSTSVQCARSSRWCSDTAWSTGAAVPCLLAPGLVGSASMISR